MLSNLADPQFVIAVLTLAFVIGLAIAAMISHRSGARRGPANGFSSGRRDADLQSSPFLELEDWLIENQDRLRDFKIAPESKPDNLKR